jgi:hypothetical protein
MKSRYNLGVGTEHMTSITHECQSLTATLICQVFPRRSVLLSWPLFYQDPIQDSRHRQGPVRAFHDGVLLQLSEATQPVVLSPRIRRILDWVDEFEEPKIGQIPPAVHTDSTDSTHGSCSSLGPIWAHATTFADGVCIRSDTVPCMHSMYVFQ